MEQSPPQTILGLSAGGIAQASKKQADMGKIESNFVYRAIAMINTIQIGMGWFPEEAGGLNRFFYDCVTHLPSAGVNIQGFVAAPNSVFQESGGRVKPFAACNTSLLKRWYGVRANVKDALQQSQDALIVSHFALYTLPLLGPLKNRPFVTHFHGPWALESGLEGNSIPLTQLKKKMEKASYDRCDRFIVLSKAFQTILHQEYRIPLDKIEIIPGGVDTDRFRPQGSPQSVREKLGWPQDRFIMLSVRRMAKRMGLENLIDAIASLRHQYPDILLYIAGKGALKSALQERIDALNLNNHVQLLGFVSDQDLPLAYQAADLSIVPTLALEGFGLIATESLASGTPVMGTPIGGIPEILRPLSEDLVFEGSSAENLIQGLQEVLSGTRTLPDRSSCVAYANNTYAWPIIAQRIKTVYQMVL